MTIDQALLPPDIDQLVQQDVLARQDMAAQTQQAAVGLMEQAQGPDPEAQAELLSSKDPTGGQEPIVKEVRDADKSDDLQNTAKKLLDVFEAYRSHRISVIEASWHMSEDLYDGYIREPMDPHLSCYEIREIFKQGEQMKARSAQVFFGPGKKFEYSPSQEGGEEDANSATHIVRKQYKMLGCDKQFLKFHDQVYHTGTSYISFDWARFKRYPRKITQVHDQKDGRERWERHYEEVEHGGPLWTWHDCWNVYVNPYIEEIEDQPFVFIRESVGAEYLRTLVNEGKFDQKTVEKIIAGDGPKREQDPRGERDEGGADYAKLYGDDQTHEVVWAWTSAGWAYAIVDDYYLPMARRNPMGRIPILQLKDNPRPGSAYGISNPMVLEAEEKLLRDVASLWVDTIYYRLQPMFIVKHDLQNTWEQTGFIPGATVYADNPQTDIIAMSTQAPVFELSSAMEYIRTGMQRTSGETDEKSGTTKHRTASGLMRLQEAAAARDQHRILLWTPIFEEIHMVTYELNAAFLDDEIAAGFDGVDGRTVFGRYGPTIFQPEVDVEVLLPHTMESDAEKQTRMMTLWGQYLQAPHLWNGPYLQEELGRSFNFRHPKRLINAPGMAQYDAMKENQDFEATGYIADPSPYDNHQTHYYIHDLYKKTQAFLELPPLQQAMFERHCAMTEQYLQSMPQAQGGGQLPMDAGMGSSITPGEVEGNARANAMLNMGQRGAMQQGAMM